MAQTYSTGPVEAHFIDQGHEQRLQEASCLATQVVAALRSATSRVTENSSLACLSRFNLRPCRVHVAYWRRYPSRVPSPRGTSPISRKAPSAPQSLMIGPTLGAY